MLSEAASMLSESVTIRYRLPGWSTEDLNEFEAHKYGRAGTMFRQAFRILGLSFVGSLCCLTSIGLFKLMFPKGLTWHMLLYHWRPALSALVPALLFFALLAMPFSLPEFLNRRNRGKEEEVTFFPGKIRLHWPASGKSRELLWDRVKGLDESTKLFVLRGMIYEQDRRHFIVPKSSFTHEQEQSFRRLATAPDAVDVPLLSFSIALSGEEALQAERLMHPFLRGVWGKALYVFYALQLLLFPVFGYLLFPRAPEFLLSWPQLLHQQPWIAAWFIVLSASSLWLAFRKPRTPGDRPAETWAFSESQLSISGTKGTRTRSWHQLLYLQQLPDFFILGAPASLAIPRKQLTSELDDAVGEFLRGRLMEKKPSLFLLNQDAQQ